MNYRRREMTHEDIWNAIERFANAHKLTCSGLAKRGGLDPTTFNRSKRYSRDGQPRWPSTQSIAKILSATDKGINDFARYLSDKSAEM
jgi:phage repressor protein C with HTH and peptisase S24 domain